MTDAPTVETVQPPTPSVPETPAKVPSMEESMSAKYDEIQARDTEPTKDAPSRVRGPDGKFLPKNPDKVTQVLAEAPNKAAEPDKTQAVEPPIEAPEHWTAEDKAEFEKLKDVEARKLAVAMSKRLEAAHTRKSQESAERVRSAEPFLGVAKQHESYLQQIGFAGHPAQYYAGLAQTEQTLRQAALSGDQRPFIELAARYGLNLGAPSQAAGNQSPSEQVLRTQLDQVNARIAAFEQRERERAEQERAQTQGSAVSEVKAFEDAKDAQGKPSHPHFSEVRERMAALMGTDPTLTLDAAYDAACWANPTVRQKILDVQKTADKAKQDEQQRLAAQQALKAGSVNVRAAGGGQASLKGANFEETMARVYDSIQA